jgi:hypothetical protein
MRRKRAYLHEAAAGFVDDCEMIDLVVDGVVVET